MEEIKSEALPIDARRKTWEAPQIVLERLLLVSAQGSNPGEPNFGPQPQGFVGPLGISGGAGTC